MSMDMEFNEWTIALAPLRIGCDPLEWNIGRFGEYRILDRQPIGYSFVAVVTGSDAYFNCFHFCKVRLIYFKGIGFYCQNDYKAGRLRPVGWYGRLRNRILRIG